MESTVIVGDVIYVDQVRRRGAKFAEEQAFTEPAPFSIAHAKSDELPVAIVCESLDPWRRTPRAVYRHGPDGFMAVRRVSIADLNSIRQGREPTNAKPGEAFPFGRLNAERADVRDALRTYGTARVLASGRDGAMARAAAIAGASRILDGALWIPSKPPLIEVCSTTNVMTLNCAGDIPVYHTSPDMGFFWRPRFHIADIEAATAHARWCATRPWLAYPTGRPDLPPPARIERMPDRSEFFRDTAEHFFQCMRDKKVHASFHTLPIDVLDGWLAFRKAEAAHGRGDPYAASAAFEALGGILDGIDVKPAPLRREGTPLQQLRRAIEEPVHHWRSYLRHMAPKPTAGLTPDDESSLSALAP